MKFNFIFKKQYIFLLLITLSLYLFFNKNFEFWEFLIVPEISKSSHFAFYDFRCVQDWAVLKKIFYDKSEIIYNYYNENNGIKPFCKLNHPRIWILIGSFLNLQNETIFLFTVYILILIYIFIFFYYIKKFNSLFLIYFFFSGSSLLLIERANNDMIIFLLFFLLTIVNFKLYKYIIYVLVVVLKIFPVFGIFYFFNDKKSFKIVIILSLIVISYFLLTYSDIILLIKNTPSTGDISFGINSIRLNIIKHFDYSLNIFIILILLILLTFIVYFKLVKTHLKKENFVNTDVFLLGSSIYISIFLIGTHFDYRLIFLFFTLPTLINLNNKIIKYFSLIILFLSLELHRLIYLFGFFGGVINSLAKVILFIILSLITLEILKKKLNYN